MSTYEAERDLYEYARIRDKTIMAEIMGKILSGHVRNVVVMNNGSPYLAESIQSIM